ncbi:hypothetical protein KR093_000794, partial [Drosophila rubida]
IAAEQMECFEQLLNQRQARRETHIQSLVDAGEISQNYSLKYFQLQRKHKRLERLRDELEQAQAALRNQQQQLEVVNKALLQQAIKSQYVVASLKRGKSFNTELLKRNRTLQTVYLEATELYRCRALMFANQSSDMEQELIATQGKSQVISDVNMHLQS